MNVATFLGRLIISTFFVAGYTTVFGTNWYTKLVQFQGTARENLVRRLALTLAPAILAVTFQFVIDSTLSSPSVYLNMQLFILVYPLLDEDLVLWDYLLRWGILVAVWIFNHPFNLWKLGLFLLVIAVVCGVIRKFPRLVRASRLNNFIFTVIVGGLYWFTYTGMNHWESFLASLYFVAMSAYAYEYWLRVYEHDQERAALTERVNYDALTNAPSFDMYHRESAAYFARTKTDGTPLALVVLDIDNFKNINDTYGHAAGNAVLIQLTAILSEVVTATDARYHFYRTGGEEFTVLFPGLGTDGALRMMQRCAERVQNNHFTFEDEVIRTTISVGMTQVQPGDPDVQATFKRGDDNLYQSKRSGRNAITVDGVTQVNNQRRVALLTYTFFTQPVVRIADDQVASNELLLRMYDNGAWRTPTVFNIDPTTTVNMLTQVESELVPGTLGINFNLTELEQPVWQLALTEYANAPERASKLAVEVRARDAQAGPQLFNRTMKFYRHAGCEVTLDEVTTATPLNLGKQVLASCDRVKFALQNSRESATPDQLQTAVTQWQALADQFGCELVLVGIETTADMALATACQVAYGQGYYFSRPVLPRMI
mgnify:CR=1 FL=1